MVLFYYSNFETDCYTACATLGYQDGNMGLVKQAVTALTKRKITELTHTYITLPLSGKQA